MKLIAIIGLAAALAGCSSLHNAGTASYTVRPIVIEGKTYCCEVAIINGKEIAELDASVEKEGDNYKVTLRERGVTAFKGQEVAAEVATVGTKAAAKAATAVMTAPAIGELGGAAIQAITK